MTNTTVYHTKSREETQKIAKDLASTLEGGDIVALSGELGAGKTTFTQGLAQAFGVQKLNSPTFVILRTYNLESKNQKSKIKNTDQKVKILYHIDLYRVENDSDSKRLGLEEVFEDQHGIVVIEWPEKMGGSLPEKRFAITFEYLGENERKITIINPKSQIPNKEIWNF